VEPNQGLDVDYMEGYAATQYEIANKMTIVCHCFMPLLSCHPDFAGDDLKCPIAIK
jgi:hypothetical protein